jgi:PIN domain nuclease of toxin-antitoxin system
LIQRLLLDIHTFLWWDSAPEHLSASVLALCRDPSVVLFLSLISLWKIQIKRGLGKLPLSLPLAQIVEEQQTKHGLQLLPILPSHIFALETLPSHHKDPFDRLLIAQAITESLPLASVDSAFASYPVSVIW